MKVLLVLSVAIAAVSTSRLPHEPTSFDYHRRFGVPNADRIRTAELALTRDPSRIAGGSHAPDGVFNYHGGMVIPLSNGFQSICGASLLTNTRSMTSAQCWDDGWSQPIQVNMIYGSRTIFIGSDGERFSTSDVQIHHNWNPRTVANNIAIIRHRHVAFTKLIQPIALPSGAELKNTFAGQQAVVTGFGRNNEESSTPPVTQVLWYVSVPVITNEVCSQTWGQFILNSTICTDNGGFRGVCNGDSGGPLVVLSNRRLVQIGVVSFGSGGCIHLEPSGYSRVSYYIDWIHSLL